MYNYNQSKNVESPAKIAARGWIYNQISKKNFTNKKHIVIASRECGDIKFLLACGVSKENIIACDIDATARRKARSLGVQVSPYGKIEDTVKWLQKILCKKELLLSGEDIASINVDLCSTVLIGKTVLSSIDWFIHDDIPVFLTVQRARDRFCSTDNRLEYLQKDFYEATDWYEYQSWSTDSFGSPMMVVRL